MRNGVSMTREVLPPRYPFSFRALLLTGLLTGCAAHVAASYTPSPPRSVQGVPLSVWTMSAFGHVCEPPWLRPSLLCLTGPEPEYTGCVWTCPRTHEDQQ
jgi:hypothetical protein